ncbi:hypothetical protein B0S90_1685 [Caldicellulosiruptor bescii]|uniref:Uncharacterized protein n=2 Tax=Caldicellulosiruptor bescii TaxID=31899 RepID=B9MS39_CALBD|nr:hypothetical protein Athe_1394 [Caldicellulosiruptor bescii DSM 6725]PBC87905.1 hypothetical protein B0S87_0825 [Caldicellulosiruptor bescii]PBC90837.1 hypothetical protein B0S89_1187 [Caldicellulosiruptor bescii]PBD03731.1 hypothetical protein B0S85_1352 [Caldicellulosiruptor bescii]PBD06635.1 hypothetical protein B0S90_1685 [Caldicellulosiruptor bescii]
MPKLLSNKVIIYILLLITVIANLWLFIYSRQKYNILFLFAILVAFMTSYAFLLSSKNIFVIGITIIAYLSVVQVLRNIFNFSDLLNFICLLPIIIFNISIILYITKNRRLYYDYLSYFKNILLLLFNHKDR